MLRVINCSANRSGILIQGLSLIQPGPESIYIYHIYIDPLHMYIFAKLSNRHRIVYRMNANAQSDVIVWNTVLHGVPRDISVLILFNEVLPS